METVLRPVARRDVQTLALIMTQAIAARSGRAYCGINPDFLTFIRGALDRPKGWSRVAWLDGQVVGFAIGAPMPSPVSPRREELLHLMVLPERWGQGIGSELLRAAARISAFHGARSIELRVQQINNRAVELYTRHGYVVTGRAGTANDLLLTMKLML